MLEEYRKISTIHAEQFDGSNEMIEKYPIENMSIFGSDHIECHILTLEGWMILNVGDWIATGIDGEYWAIKDDIFKKTYEAVEQ